MDIIKNSPITVLLCLICVNIVLMFFLVLILADGIVKYQTGFIVTSPIILLIPALLILTMMYYLKRNNSDNRSPLITTFLIVLCFFTILPFIFNIYMWTDLFDGTTEHLLP